MAITITDPFDFTHDGKTRRVDLQWIRFHVPAGEDISTNLKADTWLPNGGTVDRQRRQLADAIFDQAETVAAFQAQAAAMGLSLTPAQVGQLIHGAAEQMVRTRWEN